MNGSNNGLSCQSGSWALAAGVGGLTFVLLLVMGSYGIIAAAFLGGIVFVVLGFLFSMIFCAPMTKPGEAAKPGASAATTAPRRTEAPKPAPSASHTAGTTDTKSTSTPPPGAAVASADAEAGTAVKPSKDLPGQKELSERKGSWKYGETATGGTAGGAAAASDSPGTKPATLDAPRGGEADDLKRIKGIGPKLEQLCNRLGFYHFDQIASWSDDEVAWVDDNLEGFRGRVTRDEWVSQAKVLAGGGDTDFSNRVDKGDVY
ncbi:NADH dehydrogenase subunit E [Roseivivax jejudonensis]|uniref:NADH dehydrogenase subunit E n=1 Tax=Roseivivax jejudonensis TaxID=1529041 RepID=A0A1X6Z6V7_9RHOB|nr:hypothetical protein [Roseivivax jejudonensis]SLN42687.1 NADH dehydrogenase subunit E [Roseivivax jejudonensis]